MTACGQLALTINDLSGENKNNYIALYNGNTLEQTYDNVNKFYGDDTNTDPITENGLIPITINLTQYYLPLYIGTNTVDCCSNLVGIKETSGTFTYVGWVLIKVNGNQLKYTPICTKN